MLDLHALDFEKGNGLVTVVAQDADSGELLMVAHADREALERTLETGEMHYRSRTRGLWHKGATSGNVQRVVSLRADCDGDAVLACVKPAGPACHTGAGSCFDGGIAMHESAQPDAAPAFTPALAGGAVLAALDATIAARAAEAQREEVARAMDAAADAAEAAVDAMGGPGGAGAAGESEGRGAAGAADGAGRGAPPESQSAAAPDGARHPSDPSGTAAPRPSYTRRLLDDRNLRLKKLGEEAAELVLACGDGDRERAVEEAGDLVYHTLVALRALGLGLDDLATVLAARAR